MKKILLSLITLLITITAFAQSPELINYQAVIRNASGDLVTETAVGLRMSILQTTTTGTAVYTETHSVTTNTNGSFAIMIGSGTTSDDFSAIDWSSGPYFIKTEADITGGTSYTTIGTSQLLSVPYALYAKNGTKFTENNEGLEYDGGNITLTQPGATIKLTSPDGTVYEIGVNDNGQLSVPTSNAPSSSPTNFYLYGSFNNWDASTALQFGNNIAPYSNYIGLKYFQAGEEIKFLAAQNESIVFGGNGFSNGILIENGNAITIPSNGLYRIQIYFNGNQFEYIIDSINITFNSESLSYGTDGSGEFFFFVFLPASDVQNTVNIGGFSYGDNLNDQSLDVNGPSIFGPAASYALKVVVNFNASMLYEFLF